MTDVLTRALPELPADAEDDARRGAFGDPPTLLAGTVAAQLAIAVAPSTGRFRPHLHAGAEVAAGELIGHITGGRGRQDEVHAPVAAELRALLVRSGQLVTRGQGLAWLGIPAPESV